MSTESQKKAQAKTPTPPPTITIPVKDIVIPSKWNRLKPPEMKGLISSMKEEGQLIPLLVRLRDDGKTELVDGRRRLMAMKELKVKDAKIVYAEGDVARDYGKSLIANLQRLEHNPVEKAEAYRDLKKMGWSHKQIASSCGVVESSISQHLAVFELPGKMQRALRDEKITIGHSRQLLRVNEEAEANFQEKIFDKMVNDHLPVTVAEEMVANYWEKKELRAKKKADPPKTKTQTKSDPPPPPDGDGKKKGGRVPEMTDYMDEDLIGEMKMIDSTACAEWLASYEARRVKTTSPKKREYFRGFVEGLETACGLRGEED
jgi:ParB family chromosome partitioning protein